VNGFFSSLQRVFPQCRKEEWQLHVISVLVSAVPTVLCAQSIQPDFLAVGVKS